MEKYFELHEDGYNVLCKIYANDIHNVDTIVLFCHGFGGHKDNRAAARFAEHLISKYKKAGLITFDFPCHGKDVRKKLSLVDCNAYLKIVLDYIQTTLQVKKIYSYGTSFGGFLTLKYIYENGNPFQKLAFRCPAVDMDLVLTKNVLSEEELKKISKGKEVFVGFDRKVRITQSFLDELKEFNVSLKDFIPYAEEILIIHGTEDEVVPFKLVEKFCDENIIELIPMEGVDHRFRNPQKMDLAHNEILKFFNIDGKEII